SVPVLSAHGFPAAGVRLALSPLQCPCGRRVLDHSPSGGPHLGRGSAGRRATPHVLPAWPALGASLSPASRSFVRGPGCQDYSSAGGQFRDESFAHVAVPRLDHRPPVPVLRTAPAPVGLAPFSGSARSSPQDRKSTRLNSSHEWISYAVFCL